MPPSSSLHPSQHRHYGHDHDYDHQAGESFALIGLGAIGISFLALHLRHTTAPVRVYDTRPDLHSHLSSVLPGYLTSESEPEPEPDVDVDADIVHRLQSSGRLIICRTFEDAVAHATVIQEQGPERLDFKRSVWGRVARLMHTGTVAKDVRLWSSTSGIAASAQCEGLKISSSSSTPDDNDDADKEESIRLVRKKLLVVHPFNPPHIMPLIEIVPSPDTAVEEIEFARRFFQTLGSSSTSSSPSPPLYRPVVLNKEVTGFVGNRLAFVLLREALSLVSQGVVSVRDLDTIVEASLGPRWAVNGPFKSYHAAGSRGGIAAWFENLKVTMQDVWDGCGVVDVDLERKRKRERERERERFNEVERGLGSTSLSSPSLSSPSAGAGVGAGVGSCDRMDVDASWLDAIIRETMDTYGVPGPEQYRVRDRALREVLKVQEGIPGLIPPVPTTTTGTSTQQK